MRRFLTGLILLTLIMSPCWSQTTMTSSEVSRELKSLLKIALIELENSNKLVVILKTNLATAEKKLQDSSQSGTNSDSYLSTLELQLEQAESQVMELNKRIAELMIQSEQDSIYLSDLRVEIQLQRDKHTNEVKVIITKYEDKIRIRNTIIIVESSILVVVIVLLITFFAIN